MSALSELFIAIGIKAEGLEQLTAIHERLQQIAGEARNAIKALAELNGIKIAPSSATPASPQGTAPDGPNTTSIPSVPAFGTEKAPPRSPSPESPKFIGPHSSPWVNEQRAAAAAVPVIAKAGNTMNSSLAAVKKLHRGLGEMAIMLGAVSAATIVLISKSITATMEMANFGLATGLSTDKLQEFQHAAQVGGASGKEMAGVLDSLQMKLTEIKLGEGDISPFAMLGLDVSQNPMDVLDQLRAKLKDMTDEQRQFARTLAARMGINSVMFASLLRQSKDLSKSLVLSPDAIHATEELNFAWQDLTFSLSAVRNQITAAIAPALTYLAGKITWLVSKFSVFTNWLTKGGIWAKLLSVYLAGLAVTVTMLAIGIGFLSAAVMAVAAAMTVATAAGTGMGIALWASGIAEIILLITAVIGVFVAVATSLVLIVDDIITTFRGGESACRDFGNGIADFILGAMSGFESLGSMVADIWNGITGTISGAIDGIKSLIPDWLFKWLGGTSVVPINPMTAITQAAAQPPSNQPGGKQSSNVSQDIEINVDGSKDPQATAKAVNNGLKTALGNASYQMPAYAV